MHIEPTTDGHGYIHLIVNDEVVSQHASEYEACAAAFDALQANPTAEVRTEQMVITRFTADVEATTPAAPAKPDEPAYSPAVETNSTRMAVIEPGVSGAPMTMTGTHDGKPFSVSAPPGTRVRATYSDGTFLNLAMRHYDDCGGHPESGYPGPEGDMDLADVVIKVGDQTLYSGDLTIGPYASVWPFWYRTPKPQAKVNSLLYPSYGNELTSPESGKPVTSWDPMAIGMWRTDEGQTGEAEEIGLMPEHDVRAIINPTQDNLEVMRDQADAAAVRPVRTIDPKTNRLLIPSDYAYASRLWQCRDIEGNAAPWRPDTQQDPAPDVEGAHLPAFCYGPALVYGTSYDREQVAAVALWHCVLQENPDWRLPKGQPIKFERVQCRGWAWALRSACVAAMLGPDALKPVFQGYAESMVADAAQAMSGRALPVYRFKVDGDAYMNGRAQATWQQDYMAQAIGLAAQFGIKGAKALAATVGQLQIQRMLSDVPQELATIYTHCYVDKAGKYPATWHDSVAATGGSVLKAMQAGTGTAELQKAYMPSSPNKPGEFVNYLDGMGYAANLGAALAMLANAGVPKALEAWQAWSKRETVTWDKCKYNIVPR